VKVGLTFPGRAMDGDHLRVIIIITIIIITITIIIIMIIIIMIIISY
jgi:hypothetical protein